MPLEGYQFMILATNVVRFSIYDDLVASFHVVVIALASDRVTVMTIIPNATSSTK